MNIAQNLENIAKEMPNKTALIFENETFSYQDINQTSNQIVNGLKQFNIAIGDRVALLLPSTPEFITSYFGLLKSGAIAVTLNPTLKSKEIRFILNNCEAKIIITTSSLAQEIDKTLLPHLEEIIVIDKKEEQESYKVLSDIIKESSILFKSIDVEINTPAVILYTSGTTGFPKGATLSHNNILFSIEETIYQINLSTNDKSILVLPLFHNYGQIAILNSTLSAGATLILEKEFNIKKVLYSIQKYQVSLFFGVPTIYNILLENTTPTELSSLREFVSAGASLPQEIFNRWQEKFKLTIHEHYGLSECSMVCHNSNIEEKEGSVGKAVRGVEIKIIDEHGNGLPKGQKGEVAIKGSNIMLGYWNLPKETKEALQEGWFHSGDIGTIDESGYLSIVDRKKDMVNVGGQNVYPSEVEQVLYTHPDIKEVSAYGVVEPILGEEVRVAIILEENQSVSEADIITFCRENLADYKVPSKVEFVEHLPKSKTGKVLKRVLKKEAEERIKRFNKEYIVEVDNIKDFIKSEIKLFLGVLPNDEQNFFNIGMTSLMLIQLTNRLNTKFGTSLSTTIVLDHFNINKLTTHLINLLNNQSNQKDNKLPRKHKEDNTSVLSKMDSTPKATSFQKRLYALSQLEENQSLYNTYSIWKTKNLDIQKTKTIFKQLFDANLALKINLFVTNGEICQKINHNHFEVEVVEVESNKAIESIITNYVLNPFDLENDLLFQVAIFKKEDDFFIAMKVHHTVFDGTSANIIAENFKRLFLGQAIESTLHDYFDFTLEYEDILEQNISKQEKFWLNQFKTVPEALALPIDSPYPSVRSYEGGKEYFTIDTTLTQKLKCVAKNYNVSLNTLLFASFTILLNRISSQDDITIGVPVNTRGEKFHNSVGMFVNTIAMRVTLEENISIKTYLQEIQRTFLEALEHKEYPLEKLIEKLKIKRDASKNTLFDVMFAYEDGSARVLEELGFEEYTINSSLADFDLSLNIIDKGNQLVCDFDYYHKIFKASTIKRFVSYFFEILEEIQSDKQLSKVNVVSQEEINLLDSFNQTDKAYPKDKTIIELFEEQVKKTPNNIAVVYENTKLTYHELNQKANQLGHSLRENHNVKADTIIPIMLGRSEWMIITIFGVLKAGGAYLPIDPEYPQERVAFMLNDSSANLLLTDKENNQSGKKYGLDLGIEVIDVQELQYSNNVKNLEIVTKPNNLFYVIYTSGSTGKPKGVLIENRSAINIIYYGAEILNMSQESKVLQFASFAFDASIAEIFITLLFGATLITASKDKMLKDINGLVQKENINIVDIPPSLLNSIENIENLKTIITGGESAKVEDALKYSKTARYINAYGPTESSITATTYQVNPNKEYQTIPIGEAINNTKLYILNQENQRVPLGVSGELYIAGDGLARGYLNQPELTEKVFIKHSKLGRIYKTGDLAKYQEDGNIEYLGRVDDQVKIRGFRIELGEIENSILSFKGITEAVVLAKEQLLIAYVVEENNLNSDDSKNIIGGLKAHLKSKLPSYMIPSYFIELESLPLTSNGKIDKKALPQHNEADNSKVYIEASNETEKQLESIFCEVLKVDKVSMDDNFFEIGGHSLTAITTIAKVSKAFLVEIKLKELFLYNSIQGLAKLIASKSKVEHIEILPLEPQESYEISNAQRRLWVLDKMQDGSNVYNMPEALSFKENLNSEVLQESVKRLINRHEILRTNFKERAGEVRQVISKEVNTVVIEELTLEKDEVDVYLLKASTDIFDLEKDALITVKVINKNILFVNMHHIISDGWSIAIIVKELSELYTALDNKEEPNLKPLSIHYKEYTAWQNNLLKNEAYVEKHQSYWHEALKGHQTLEFPLDHSRPSSQTFEGSQLNFKLNTEQSRKLKSFSKESTLFTVILTITNILLSKYSNQEDILLGTPIANRGHEQLFDQIGFYVNTLALRTKLDNTKSFEENLSSITEKTLEAFEHQSYPFDKLVDELDLERDLSQNPLFNMMIILQNTEQNKLNFSNNETEIKVIESKSAKFDMTFNYMEIEEEIELNIEYNTALFNASTIERLFLNLETLIANISNTTVLNELNIISNEEQTLLESFNQTQKEYPKDKTIIELFEEQVKKTPNNIAVVYEERELTYEELNQKANQLGHYLRATQKIQADTLVPIMLDRSEWMIIAILGVLKAGGAYLPIDPAYPEDRINYILEDSQARLLLCDKVNYQQAEEYSNKLKVDVIEVEGNSNKEDSYKSSNTPIKNLNIINQASDLAYVIYTSGSTGKPKGVMVEHSGIVNAVLNQIEVYGMNDTVRLLQFTTFTFDVSVSEILTTLFSGATLVTAKKEKVFNQFNTIIKDYNINMVNITPSFLQSIDDKIEGLNLLVTAGESATVTDAIKHAKDSRYINAYGPTETFYVSMYQVNPNKTYKTIPIGKPLANTKLYILDQDQTQLPLGAIGELYIAGEGLARGYLNKPELTEKVFITHPKLGRIYKTGDIAKYQKDGNIEYLGRVDDQVKIRGFRIELGEIENSILSFKGIKESVVLAKEQQLIAYVVKENALNTKSNIIEELKSHLKSKLPSYMIPSYFIELENLPLTPNGKIDKKALPSVNEADNHKVYIEASNEIEEQLAGIFGEVLKLDKVSMDDNFFEIGGHSLRAISTIANVSKAFSVEIKLKELFIYNSIQGLAKLIASKSKVEHIEILPLELQESYEISNAQRRLWVLDKMQDGSNVYNMPGSLRFKTNLTISVLQESVTRLINRHEILRTNFKESAGELRQVISAKVNKVVIEELSIQEDEVDAYLLQAATSIFDLEKDVLIDVKVINRNILFVNMHHIISDGWSITIIIKELSYLYTALDNKEEPKLNPLSIHYKEYTAWQNNLLKDEAYLKKHQIYWHEALKGHQTLEFPLDHSRPSSQTFEGNYLNFKLNQEQSRKLKSFTKESTLFTVILTITNILLSKYSNQEDILLGTPIANRGHEQLFDQIGFYVNTLALRTKLDNTKSFEENLLTITEKTLEAFEHQSYPFDKLVDELDLERDLSQNPLFNMMIVLQNNEQSELNFSNNQTEVQAIDTKSAKFDMTFNYTEIEEEIVLEIEYNTALFNATTIERLFLNLEMLIANINNTTILNELNIISNEEQTLLKSFNETQKEYPKDKTIIELFEEQVRKSPNNIAVVYEERELTYQELNQRANSLAHYLIELGISTDDLVGVNVNRSLEMIISILGVLKSGGAYIPIDSSYPEDRVEYMIQDSKAKVVLTNKALKEKLTTLTNTTTIISIEEFNDEHIHYPIINPKVSVKKSNLMYVLYTSGSTGTPKGVMVEHHTFINLLQWYSETFNINESNKTLLIISFAFDASTKNLLAPLVHGGELILSDGQYYNPEHIIDLIDKHQITLINSVPSAFKPILNLLENKQNGYQALSSLKDIAFAGESLDINFFKRFLEVSNINIFNTYGPTEATDVTHYKQIDRVKQDISIGKSIPNTKAYILNQTQTQLPLGARGELYIAGDGLARGYLNQPELTNKVFINHPTLGRIYKTGDIAKYQEDGNIEYLGRVDDQVKIRGFRIELGEIENSILSFKGIKEAVVLAKEQQLIAYVVEGTDLSNDDSKNIIEALKAHLKSKLPSYMIPSYFIELESLPLTPNGKIDKKALPSVNEADNHKVYIEASNETEKKLESIFCEVLKVDKVSMDDNFFEVGGHSLTAITTIAKVSKTFSVEIKLKELFIYNSIQGLAKLIASKTKVEHIAILPLEPQKSYEVSNAQRRLWVLDKMQDGSNVYNMPEALRFKENLNMEVLQESVTRLINRHEILRTNFKERAGEVRQVISKEVNEDIIEVLELKEDEVNDYLLKSATAIFDLEKDALLSLKVINGNILFVNMHHIVSDGWSIAIIVKELSELYTALDNKEEPKLKPLTIHYKEYTAWQNNLLKNEAYLEKHQSYWHEALKGHQTLEFPLDHSRPSSQSFEGSHLNFKLNTEQSRKLKSYTKNSTLFTVILTITNILLSKYSNQEDILLGTPIANRGHEQLFDQIGLYVNTLALRTKLDNTKSFEENLSSITEKTLEAFEHQSYPFDKLVDELDLERDLSQNPLFNMMIVLQNNEQSELNFSNNQTELQVIDTKSAKFDMTFNYMEIEEEIVLNIEYNTALFNASTIERLFLNLETLVENISNTTVLNELNIISNQEQTLLQSFNQTQKEYPKDKTIIELFEEQVKKTPNNIAVVYEKRELTYEELNQKANQLGHYLRVTQNIQADTLVPIMVDRSEWMIIAILGVLKSGGAYLPIDPEYPEDRISYMLNDSKAKILLSDMKNRNKADTYSQTLNIQSVDVEALDYSTKGSLDDTNLEIINSSSDLAYVIYTSGSTGKPKGVMLTQSNVTSFTANMKKKFNIKERETIYAITTIAFDISVLELISSLLTNLTVVIASSNNLEENIKEIENNPIDIIQTTPTRYNALMDLNPQALKKVNKLLIGGEKLNKEVLSKLQTLDCELYNVYGPTEATVWSTVKRVDIGELNIGQPLCNEMAYILDQNQQELPLGAIGELYIAGDGLARGYLNKPELTKKVFINHPTLGRIYKTGDIAKYQEDGNIEYLGRVDDQVKIRGFRIELGEIENSILSFKGIKEAVVLAKEQQLIAYVVKGTDLSNDDSKNIIEALKVNLKSKLPSYMIPSYFIELESLPLTPNGKIDKKALPSVNEVDNHKVYIEASNETEKKLESIFCEVLKVDKVSMDDNFFEVGGHSLTAITTIAKVSKAFSVEIKLKELFIYNSIQGLAKLIASKTKVEHIAILPLEPQESYEVSNAQRRLWVLDKMQDGSNVYNMPEALRFKENLNIEVLQESVTRLINRHEILRTNFKERAGEVRQVISKEVNEDIIEVLELKEDEVNDYLLKSATAIFDLEKDALLSLKVINGNILFVNMHHIVSDGWSIAIIVKELSELYTALDNKEEPKLKPLTIHYKEYTAWQNNLLKNEAYLEKHQSYWHEALKGHQTLEFPLDHSRPSSQSFEGSHLNFKLNTEQSRKLKSYTKNSTLFTVILTITNILLSKYSNQEDILLGTPIANRGHEQLFDQIGLYINTLALRTKLDNTKSFEENLSSITEKTLEAFEHQSYPFDKLVDELDLERDLSQNPIFNMMIVLQNNEQNELNFSNNQTELQVIDTKSAKFDMTFNYMEIEEEIVLNIEYNTALFKASTIERLFLNLETLVENISNRTVLNELNIISNEEQTLLQSFNQTQKEYPKDKTIIELFEEQVKKTPNNIAVVYEKRELTYEELNQKANQLGHYLRVTQNIQADTLVPIMVDRSEWMIIAILGVLKSGGAYLPIDPEYPEDRISYMLEDSQARLLLCDTTNYAKTISELDTLNLNIIDIETFGKENNALDTNLESINSASNLAYVIYTSGSTGKPKGVMLTHSNLSSFTFWGLNEFKDTSFDLMYFATSYCFDISLFEIFFTLAKSKTIKVLKSGIDILNHLHKDKNIFINTVPSVVKLLLEEKANLSNVTTLNMAGEPIAKNIIDSLIDKEIDIRNLYGPTEATIYATSYQFKDTSKVLIGKSLSNNSIYILDQHQMQLPLGAIGELYIAGDSLARGYLNKPELTEQVFINHPNLGRIYKTGDIVKYQEDGNIEYLGRVDDQVKIRGFRIELGEIENSILSFKGIKEAVVLAKEQQLIAYVVEDTDLSNNDSENIIEALKAHLKSKLPSYMIPSYFIELESLPLTPNGKIDKKALPEVNQEESGKTYIEPKNENETIVIEAFLEVLTIKKISTEDNFFEIGGDSIKAIQITSKIASKGYKLDIKSIFKASSIKELATYLEKSTRVIAQISVEGAIELNPIQQWFFENSTPKNHFNQSVFFKMKESISEEILNIVIKKLQIHHDILRVNYPKNKKGEFNQINHAVDFPIDVEVVKLKSLESIEAQTDTFQASFNIEESSLMKVVLFKTEQEEDRLLIILHHLIVDGVSWRILLEDFNNAYNDYKNGLDIQLPLKTDSFKSYTVALNSYVKTIPIQLAYWQEVTNHELIVPCDNEVVIRLGKNRKSSNFTLSKEETRNLLEESNFAYNTQINDLLLTALSLALYRSFSMKEVLITLEGHGREEVLDVDLSRTIGWFTTAYPVKLAYHQEQTLEHQIKHMKESLRSIPDKGLGYGVLKYISKEALSYTPQISFNYLGEFDNSLNTELFEMARESAGASEGEDFTSEYKLDMNAIITDNQFSMSIAYDEFEFNEERIEQLTHYLKASLVEVVEHCQRKESTELTPSDIDADNLDIEALNNFLEIINKGI